MQEGTPCYDINLFSLSFVIGYLSNFLEDGIVLMGTYLFVRI